MVSFWIPFNTQILKNGELPWETKRHINKKTLYLFLNIGERSVNKKTLSQNWARWRVGRRQVDIYLTRSFWGPFCAPLTSIQAHRLPEAAPNYRQGLRTQGAPLQGGSVASGGTGGILTPGSLERDSGRNRTRDRTLTKRKRMHCQLS